MWNTRKVFAFAVLASAVAFTVLAVDVDATVNGQPGPGMFPRALGIAMIALAVVNLLREVMPLRRPAYRQPVAADRGAEATVGAAHAGEAAGDVTSAPASAGRMSGAVAATQLQSAAVSGISGTAAPTNGISVANVAESTGISVPGNDAGTLEGDSTADEASPGHPAMVVYMAGLTVAFVLLFQPLGAVVAVVLFGAAAALVLRWRGWLWPGLVVVVTSVALVLLTQIVLRQDLPAGVLQGVPFVS